VEIAFQALIMGVVQGLTEFLPVSSSGHLIIVPWLFGWTDPFIDSLAFSVMLHIATLVALLIYFREDWLRLIPAGLAAIRDRSLRNDPDRRLAWLLAVATVPAVIAGILLSDAVENAVREPRLVAITLTIGALILWVADRVSARTKDVDQITFPVAFGIGVAQAIALVPGISRSGMSIAAGLFVGLTREAAARFSFLMATPVIAGAGIWELKKLATGEAGVTVAAGPLVIGMVAALISGLVAIAFVLRYLRTNSTAIFVIYRIALTLVVVVLWLNLWGR
jgi:undecaprenyl-diphosphatase